MRTKYLKIPTRKKSLSIIIFLLICINLFSLVSCSHNTPNNSSIYNSDKFIYPDKKDFRFTVDTEKVTVQRGQTFNISCSVENKTNKKQYIEHGIECITYSYNGEYESLNTIAVLDTFDIGEQIERNIELTAKESGKVTITAYFRVKSSEYTDSFKEYSYTKSVDITVI